MTQPTTEGINPAWQGLLGAIPESLHGIIIPHLKQWDTNFNNEVQKRVTEAVAPYEPYKVLVDNKVPMERIDETLRFVYTLENDPEQTVKNLAEHFKVEFQEAAPAGQHQHDDDDPFSFDEDSDMKIEDHPLVKQLLEQSQRLQEEFDAQKEERQNETALQQFSREIDEFLSSKEEYKVIPKELLIAYMSQDATPEEAAEKVMGLVKSQITIPGSTNQQQLTQTPPTLMGGDGAAGSGLPDNALNPGSMTKGDTTDLVTKMLEAAAQQNSQ